MDLFWEGYWLWKQTWRVTLKFWIPFYLLIYPFVVLAGSQTWIAAGIGVPRWVAPACLALYTACLPAKWYVDLVIMSSPYYGEPVHLGALLKRGCANWWRLTQLAVLTGLAALPVSLLPFVMRHLVSWGVVQLWSTLVVYYALLAALSMIRFQSPVLASVKESLKLVPWREWFQTVALLTVLDLLYHYSTASIVSLARHKLPLFSGVLPPTRAALSLSLNQLLSRALNFIPGWYLQLCAVAVWHRYKHGESGVSLDRTCAGRVLAAGDTSGGAEATTRL